MIRSLHLSADQGIRAGLTQADMVSLCREAGGVIWVDITGDGPQERSVLHDAFGFHQLAIEDCYNGRTDTPKVDDYRDYLFIAAQSVHFFGRSERLSGLK